jgi:hypothetical protein
VTLLAARHLGGVVRAQARLLRPSIWIASALGILLATLYALTLPSRAGEMDVLTFALPLIAGAGTAFLYGPETDPGLELALATPTSARAVLLSRFALLFGFDAGLALVATATLAALRGDGFWTLTLLWLGPMALLSTLSLALSLFLSPALAAAAALALWISRAVRFDGGASLGLSAAGLWHTSLQILAISLTLLLVAALYVPRRAQLVHQE